MASPSRWTWVWVNFRSWWWPGRPGMLQSMGSQRVGHNWGTELNWYVIFMLIIIIYKAYFYLKQVILTSRVFLFCSIKSFSLKFLFNWKMCTKLWKCLLCRDFFPKEEIIPKIILWLSCSILTSFESNLANHIPEFFFDWHQCLVPFFELYMKPCCVPHKLIFPMLAVYLHWVTFAAFQKLCFCIQCTS